MIKIEIQDINREKQYQRESHKSRCNAFVLFFEIFWMLFR